VGRPQPPGRSDMTLRSRPTGVARLPDETSSDLRWSSTDLLRRLRELKIVRRIPDGAGSSPAYYGMRLGLNITTVRHFLHWSHRALSWTGSYAERRQSPFSPIRTNGPFLLELRMTRPYQPRQWLFWVCFRQPLCHSWAGRGLSVRHFLH